MNKPIPNKIYAHNSFAGKFQLSYLVIFDQEPDRDNYSVVCPLKFFNFNKGSAVSHAYQYQMPNSAIEEIEASSDLSSLPLKAQIEIKRGTYYGV